MDKDIRAILSEFADVAIRDSYEFNTSMNEISVDEYKQKVLDNTRRAETAIHRIVLEAMLDAVKVAHNNINVDVDLIKKIQPDYEGNQQVDAYRVHKELCNLEDHFNKQIEKLG